MHILSIGLKVLIFPSYVFLYFLSYWEGIGEFIMYGTQDEEFVKNNFILTLQNYFKFI